MKNSNNKIANRTRNLPDYRAVSQPAAPPRDTEVGIPSRRHRRTEVSSQLHTLVALPPGEQPLVATEQQDARGPQTAWTLCGTEKSLTPPGIETRFHRRPVRTEIEGQRQLKHNTNAVSARHAQQTEICRIYDKFL